MSLRQRIIIFHSSIMRDVVSGDASNPWEFDTRSPSCLATTPRTVISRYFSRTHIIMMMVALPKILECPFIWAPLPRDWTHSQFNAKVSRSIFHEFYTYVETGKLTLVNKFDDRDAATQKCNLANVWIRHNLDQENMMTGPAYGN